MRSMTTSRHLARLLGATAIGLVLPFAATAQQGFAITINGQQIAGDPAVAAITRTTDLQLAQADVRVQFDGLGAEPRLDVEVAGPARAYGPGDTVTLQSALNYPAFVTRAEMRIVDQSAIGGARTVLVSPVAPNGQTTLQLPASGDFLVVHRVYDSAGRYDETQAIPLGVPNARGLAQGVEDGNDSTARRRIPVYGGAVTVSGSGVTPGARVTALGEIIPTDPSGGFVVQRILPQGDYGVDVAVQGAGQNVALVRDIAVPGVEAFYVATIDLTYGVKREEDGDWEPFDTGRLAGFVDAQTASGYRIIASADSGEGDVSDIFSRFDDRNPRELLLRLDPEDFYPTYGDDSTIEDRTPTSGNLFVRVERDNNYLQWGDFEGRLSGDGYVRNERTLYGLEVYGQTQDVTSRGDPRFAALLYAAQPEQLPQRDIFQGTGGSVYFLDKQDIARSTEVLTIQLRDGSTGRVIETRTLIEGEDYRINYIQGIVTLNEPLQAGVDTGVISNGAGDDIDVVLIAQYEYTPTAGDVDGLSYGGRIEGWITDDLRVGVSGTVDETGLEEQTLVGADLLWRLGETSFVRIEAAQSEGPGQEALFSADGGLIFDSTALAAGTGEAIRAEAQVTFGDMGLAGEGVIAAYVEHRTEGFSSLDAQVTSATGDEEFWGVSLEAAPSATLTYAFRYDDYANAMGEVDRTGTAEVAYALNPRITLTGALEYVDVLDSEDDGSRTDAALRISYALSEAATVYVFGQGTVQNDGLEENDRYGLGGTLALGGGWQIEGEVSDGSQGTGARILARQTDPAGNTRYAGWTLEPDREVSGIDLDGRDRGQFVLGGRTEINERVAMFGESTYDAFGRYRTLTNSYGLTYAPNEAWATSVAFEIGRVEDDFENDFDRHAVSIGTRYATERIESSLRLEYRLEEGTRSGDEISTETLLLAADVSYRIDDAQRFVFSADLAQTQTDESTILDGDYTDVVLGYAYRPVEGDRMSFLGRLRYLDDEYGQRVDGEDERGPRQRSFVASADLSYDVNPNWTLGGKLGYRLSETSEEEGAPYVENDAWLAVASARYHLVTEWDALIEVRGLGLVQAETTDWSVLAAGYRQINPNVSLGLGYNFGRFSDDLTDLVQDDEGVFINLIAQF